MDDALSLLADLPTGEAGVRQVADLLAHFWNNRALANSLLQGTALRAVRSALVAQIEARLEHMGGRLRLHSRLAAHALADVMLSPVLAWLRGEAPCSPADLAAALRDSSAAMLASLRV